MLHIFHILNHILVFDRDEGLSRTQVCKKDKGVRIPETGIQAGQQLNFETFHMSFNLDNRCLGNE